MEDSPEKICSCNGGLRIGSTLKRCQVALKSCKNCGDRCTIDELEPIKAKSFSVGLNAQNLNWNDIPKGRRSRKSIARSFNGVAKLTSGPERVADFSGCDSDKFVEPLMGQPTSGKSEHIPIKKRRQLPLAPQPWVATFHQNSPSAQPQSSLHHNEKKYHLRCRNRSAGPASKRSLKSRGIDGPGAKSRKGCGNGAFTGQQEGEYLKHDDFSGIQLLATAAIMEDDAGNPTKEYHVIEDSPNSKSSNATCLATLCKVGSKSYDLRNSSSIASSLHKDHSKEFLLLNACAATAQDEIGTTPDSVPSKEDRRHWDLNVLMDAWDDPYDDSAAGSNSKSVSDFHMHLEGEQENSEDPLVPASGGTEIEPKLDVEELTLKLISTSYSTAAGEAADQAVDSKQVTETDEILDSFLRFSSSMSTSERKKKTFSGNVATAQDEDSPSLRCSSSVLIAENIKQSISGSMAVVQNECFTRTANVNGEIKASGLVQVLRKTEDVTGHYLPATEMSASFAPERDAKSYRRSSELGGDMSSLRDNINNSVTCNREYVYNPKSNSDEMSCFSSSSNSGNVDSSGTFAQHSVVATDCKSQNVASTTADCKGHFKLDELVAKQEIIDLPNEGSQMIKLEESCNSYIARAKTGVSTMSPEQVDSAIDAPADSPYEDGELRVSYLSCEENEMETECVDSEFDGINKDGSEIVEGVSDCSHDTERRSSTARTPTEGNDIKNRTVKCFMRKFMEDDSTNDDIGSKKKSNGGSGTTIEQSLEAITEETDKIIQRRHFADQRYPIRGKTSTGGYTSRMAWGKFQSRIEEGLSLKATNGRGGFSDFRSRRIGYAYGREQDNSPGKYVDRCRQTANRTERDGASQWTNWGLNDHYSSAYQGSESRYSTRPRNVTYDPAVADKFHFNDQSHNANYSSKGTHRPFERTGGWDSSFRGRQRMSRPRNRGSFARSPNRHIVGDFESISGAARLPHHNNNICRRENSFSPSSVRRGDVPLTHGRSRSRSRTRWATGENFYRERDFGRRRLSRSPDFRSQTARTSAKPMFASDGYMSKSHRSNNRWVVDDDNKFDFRRKKSPPGSTNRYPQQFEGCDQIRSPDEDFRPSIHQSGKFVSRDIKFGNNYAERKREDTVRMRQDLRRFRPLDGLVNDSNTEDVVRDSDRRAFITLT